MKKRKVRAIWIPEQGHDGKEYLLERNYKTKKECDHWGRPVKFIEADRKG